MTGIRALAEALVVNTVLTNLHLAGNNMHSCIGDSGACVLAEALKVNAVLTKLDIGYNR